MFDPFSKSFNTHLNFPRTFDDHPDSGVCSPPLWRTSPPKSPSHRHNSNYQNLSSVSNAQVIARGQRELMEMVSKMPESCYELSLKDLVEVNTDEEKVFDEMPQRKKKQSKVVRKTKSDKWVYPMIRNGGVNVNNSGLFLKLVFPVSLGSKKKTKKKDEDDSSVTSKSSWISPRHSISDSSMKPEDKDWWKDGLSESRRRSQRGVSRISSGGSSSRSNSDRSRNTLRDENRGCLSFLWNVTSTRLKRRVS